jgi:hypothetical protein
MIRRRRVAELAQQKAGLGALDAFLDEVQPDVDAMVAMDAKLKAMLRDTPQSVPPLHVVATAVDWFRDRWADYPRLQALAREGALLAGRELPIASRHTRNARRKGKRKAKARQGALFVELQKTRAILDDFVRVEREALTWIWETLPRGLPFLCRRR